MALICRTCLLENEENEIESIFAEKLVGSERALTISEMVSLCTGVEISKRDKFSNYICKQCINDVIIAFKYRKKCWQTQKILLELRAQENELATIIIDQTIELTDDDNSVNSTDVNFIPETEPVNIPDDDNSVNSTDVNFIPETEPVNIPEKSCSASNLNITATLRSDVDLIQYMKIPADDLSNGRPIVCKLCLSSYKRIGHLRSHLGKVHKIPDITKFKCKICEKSFSSANILKVHNKIHTNAGLKEICEFCGKIFDRPVLLDLHLRRHRGDKSFCCDVCDFRAVTVSELSIHKRSHSGDKPFKCHLCPAAYKNPSHRANHIRSHSDERPYKCSLCSTRYKTRNTYRNHMNLHDPTKAMICEICNRIFKTRRNLRAHMALHGAKRFKCTKCEDVAFYLRSGLMHHMKIIHRIIDETQTKPDNFFPLL